MLGIQRLESFAQWCKDTDRRGYVPEAQNFDGVEMAVTAPWNGHANPNPPPANALFGDNF
jgi:hypothetical protein